MIDLTTYALLRKQITTAASGISDVRAEGDELVFVLADGNEVRVAIPATEIRDAVVRDDVLVLTLEDDKEVVVDTTLTQSGQAADAKVTGDVVSQLKNDLAAEQTAREEAGNVLRADLNANANADAVTRRSLDALWKLNQGITYEFQTDDAESAQKTVPSGAKLACVQNIGGKTEVIDTALVSADVISLNVIGKNVFSENVSKIDNVGNGYYGFEIGGLIPSAVYTVSVSNTDYVKKYGKIFDKKGENWIGHQSVNSLSIKAGAPRKVIAKDNGTILIVFNIYEFTSEEDFLSQVRATWQDLQIEIGEKATGYSPYHSETIPIPESVRALPGYGWSAGDVCNSIERTADGWQYVQRVGSRSYQEGDIVTDGVTAYYVLDNPAITDITDLMADFPAYFEVEAGGTITMENATMLPVPSTEKYLIALAEVNG